MRAAIYARQSVDRDGQGAAVTRQIEDCRALAAARGWSVVEIFVDNDASASTAKVRPAYQRLLNAVQAGHVDQIAVWHVDRLTRRLVELEHVIDVCEATGVRLATVTGDLDLGTDTGRMLARILASVARAEVERKGQRQRRANLQRAQAGLMGWTRRPFGYDRTGGVVVEVAAEAAALRKAAQAVLGSSTLAAAVRDIDAAGLTTTAGKPWNVTSLRRALLNPRYAGRALYRGEDTAAGQWPVILDAEVQARLAEVLRDVRRRVQQGTAARHLLSGVARCGRCDAILFGSPMSSKGHRWQTYKCRHCYLSRRADLVDEVVEVELLARLALPDAAALLSPDVDLDGLRAKAVELRDRRDALAAMLADGLLSAAAVREQSTVLTARLHEVEASVARAVGEHPAAAMLGAADVLAVWEKLDLRTRKAVVDALVVVRVLPAGKGVQFSAAQVAVEWK